MDSHGSDCNASRILLQAGLARTTQRMAVLNSLLKASIPLTIREIAAETGHTRKINRVTIYRTLALLIRKGIIREIRAGQGGACYEMACLHNPIHPHFLCLRCKRVLCLPPLTLSQAWEWFARPYNFSIASVNVNLTGTCNLCRTADDCSIVASEGGAPG